MSQFYYQKKQISSYKAMVKANYMDAYNKFASEKSVAEIIDIAIDDLKQYCKNISIKDPELALTEREERELEYICRNELRSFATF